MAPAPVMLMAAVWLMMMVSVSANVPLDSWIETGPPLCTALLTCEGTHSGWHIFVLLRCQDLPEAPLSTHNAVL